MNRYSDGQFLIKLIKHRIEEYKDIFRRLNLDTVDKSEKNALYWAIYYEQVEDVALFLKHGISQNIAPNLNAFDYALKINNQKIIELLDKEKIALSA